MLGYHLRLAALFVEIYFKSRMEYRQAFFMGYVVQWISRGVEVLGIWILLSRFDHIHGWSFTEVLFLYGLNMLSYGLAGVLLFGPVQQLEGLVQNGTFDSLLVMPVNPLFHLVARYFNAVFLGHILLGLVILGFAGHRLGVGWSLSGAFFFAAVALGAALIQGAIMLAAGTTSFWFVKSRALVNTAVHGVRRFITYPISIYDRWIQVFLTLILPFAFVSFFPAENFLGKEESSIFPAFFQWGTPIVGVVLFFLAYRLWVYGLDHYQSTGS
jgi:ABC-2 type transport system permease protein